MHRGYREQSGLGAIFKRLRLDALAMVRERHRVYAHQRPPVEQERLIRPVGQETIGAG